MISILNTLHSLPPGFGVGLGSLVGSGSLVGGSVGLGVGLGVGPGVQSTLAGQSQYLCL